MLTGHQTIGSYTRSNVSLWMLMSFQAGLINIGGFLACGRFVSHVTGFAGYFGYEIARRNYPLAFGMLVVPIFFLIGAMVSGELVDVRIKSGLRPKYDVAFGIIFCMISAVFLTGLFGYFGEFGRANSSRTYLLLSWLTFACGIQNGTVTSVSKAVIRTTHLSGITTDLGLGLIRLIHHSLFRAENLNEKRAVLMRVGLITFFFIGSIIGAVAFTQLKFWAFGIPLVTSGILFALMVGPSQQIKIQGVVRAKRTP